MSEFAETAVEEVEEEKTARISKALDAASGRAIMDGAPLTEEGDAVMAVVVIAKGVTRVVWTEHEFCCLACRAAHAQALARIADVAAMHRTDDWQNAEEQANATRH